MRKTLAAIGAGMLALLGAALPAGAVATDPTGGAYGTAVSDLQSNVTGIFGPPLFVLAAIVLGVTVGLHFVRKIRSAAS